MTTIPQVCLEYTKVFQVLKLELAVALVLGIIIGYIARKLDE